MINLFKKVYANYDTDMRSAKTQKRIFATDREYPYPITPEPAVRRAVGILGVFKSGEEFLEAHGGLEGTLHWLFDLNEKVCLIATHELATLLSMSVFKSIIKNPTLESAYTFYRAVYMHERAMSVQNITDFDNSLAYKGELAPMFSVDEFETVYHKAVVCEKLQAMEPADTPIEFLMAHYFGNPTGRSGNNLGFLTKYRAIALENAIFRIRVARASILTNSIPVSKFLGREVDEIHAIDELMKDPRTSWLADPALGLYSEEEVLAVQAAQHLRQHRATLSRWHAGKASAGTHRSWSDCRAGGTRYRR
jgi:hypothetical protein